MTLQESPDQIERESQETVETPSESLDLQSTASNENDSLEASNALSEPVEGDSSALSDDPDTTEPDKPEPAPAPEPSASSDVLPGSETEGPAWYVIHCYSGYENKVRHNLEQRIETMGMKDKIFDVVIPTQEEIEVKDGKRRSVERHIFPGYVLVNMHLTEESWYVVRNTPGVTGFVGMGNNPTPLRPEEVAQIIKRMEADAPTVKVTYKVGERVRIIDGPFNDFRGVVAEIDMERTKVRVNVSFFGRETPVELDFLQVEKA
jgi:transcriptional antiterminator NusG